MKWHTGKYTATYTKSANYWMIKIPEQKEEVTPNNMPAEAKISSLQ